MYLVRKYANFKRLHLKESSKETAEKELDHLSNKIEKLLARLEVETTEDKSTEKDECVICLSASAIIESLPCGHKVLCRKCFIKTIQTAISQRSLPLKCIVCRSKVLKINHSDPDGGCQHQHQQQQQQQSRARPKSVARCRADSQTTTTAAQMTSHSTKSTPVVHRDGGGGGRTKGSLHQSPIVATRLMQPLLIYPSRSSPLRQTAFLARTVDVCVDTPRLRAHRQTTDQDPKRTAQFQSLFLRGS